MPKNNMTREKENYNAFLLHFLERLNGCESIENKITEITYGYLRILWF